MPNFIRGIDIFSDALDLYLPTKKPVNKKGIIFKKKIVIAFNLLSR